MEKYFFDAYVYIKGVGVRLDVFAVGYNYEELTEAEDNKIYFYFQNENEVKEHSYDIGISVKDFDFDCYENTAWDIIYPKVANGEVKCDDFIILEILDKEETLDELGW